jgi:hypothetical protein
VSKIKSPQEKKTLSLKNDRRNRYGENSKSSRKGIRRGKQRSHMEERRAVGLILSHLRKTADENDATEADISAKTKIVESRHLAFKKTPDVPLGIVVKRKLASREPLPESETREPVHFYLKINSEGIFDTPYVRGLHKREIMFHVRYRVNVRGWGTHLKKSKLVRNYHRKEAARWREAILRDAPLLRGFFAEEPQWRDRMLRWCEKDLSS